MNYTNYHNLGVNNQSVLKLIAVLGRPVAIKELMICYRKAEQLFPGTIPRLIESQIRKSVKSLKDLGAVSKNLEVEPVFSRWVLEGIVKSGQQSAYMAAYGLIGSEIKYHKWEQVSIFTAGVRYCLWAQDANELERMLKLEKYPDQFFEAVLTIFPLFATGTKIRKIPDAYISLSDDIKNLMKPLIILTACYGVIDLTPYIEKIALEELDNPASQIPRENLLFILLNQRALSKVDLKNPKQLDCAFQHLDLGNPKLALDCFKQHKKSLIKSTKGRNLPVPGVVGLIMAFLEVAIDLKVSNKIEKSIDSGAYQYCYSNTATHFVSYSVEQLTSEKHRSNFFENSSEINFELINQPLALYGLAFGLSALRCFENRADLSQSDLFLGKLLNDLLKGLKEKNMQWIFRELLQISKNLKSPSIDSEHENEQLLHKSCIAFKEQDEPWVRDLEALKDISEYEIEKKKPKRLQRIAWFLDYDLRELIPKLQIGNKIGGWTSGKLISLRSAEDGNIPDCATAQDRQILSRITQGWQGYGSSFQIKLFDVFEFIIGHSAVYFLDGIEPILFNKIEPKLILRNKKNILELEVSEKTEEMFGYGAEVDSDNSNQINLMVPSKKTAKVISHLLENPLKFPLSKVDKFYPVISSIRKSVSIDDFDLIENDLVKDIPTNSVLTCRLRVTNDFIGIRFVADPFGNKINQDEIDKLRPVFSPGEGEKRPIYSIENTPFRCVRDFAAEVENWEKIEKITRDTEGFEGIYASSEVTAEVSESSTLELLEDLKAYSDSGELRIEWADEKKKISTVETEKPLKTEIKSTDDAIEWFALSGKLQVSESQILEFDVMLDDLFKSNSRFVKINENQFLSLTEKLASQLRLIASMKNANKQGHLPPSAALLIKELVSEDDVELSCNKKWQNKINSFSPGKLKPRLSQKFSPILRSYQDEGFKWLSNMHNYGLGACLADDMGLGKTIQCLAFLSSRKRLGATLIVTPTSLTYNWKNEIEKHCLNLKTRILVGQDRSQALKPKLGEIFLIGYGQLVRDIESLILIKWDTVVLDECQAIKNPVTQRAKAVGKLQSKFRVGLSGTPVENHLGELWSIFNFLNPGLLGSITHFKETYSGKGSSKKTIKLLNFLIQPFLLRRTKKEVMKELPDKLEKTLIVQPCKKEQAFHEALRIKLVKRLETLEPRKRYIESLAALTKLRRAACHPSLIDSDLLVPSSKHEALHDLLSEIIQNGRQVLVFSQFVGHLEIVRNYLEEQDIGYQYLDGKTLAKKRQNSVDAFQRGEGSVFLISLKAGGFGLNLTAAEYVIHLDPWWNPAVEDQASDRSHRIGQDKIVNIYRLVVKDSIEEKILSLHSKKRELTDQILSDKTKASSFSGEELFELLSAPPKRDYSRE